MEIQPALAMLTSSMLSSAVEIRRGQQVRVPFLLRSSLVQCPSRRSTQTRSNRIVKKPCGNHWKSDTCLGTAFWGKQSVVAAADIARYFKAFGQLPRTGPAAGVQGPTVWRDASEHRLAHLIQPVDHGHGVGQGFAVIRQPYRRGDELDRVLELRSRGLLQLPGLKQCSHDLGDIPIAAQEGRGHALDQRLRRVVGDKILGQLT